MVPSNELGTSHEMFNASLSLFLLKLVGILWNRTLVEVVDKLSSTTVDFIRSERELENKHALIWNLKCLLSMLSCMLGSVKSEDPKGKGKLENGNGKKTKN